MTIAQLASHIDHTGLQPDTTESGIETLCSEAHRHGFATVCVMPYFVRLASRLLTEARSPVAVCTTIGFPNGAHMTTAKLAEAEQALADGATELDMVLNLGALKSGRTGVAEEDIRAVAAAAHSGEAIVKVILETALLSDDEKRLACMIAERAGADFVKTSTGFSRGGATVADVRLMRQTCSPNVRVKASGGIRDHAAAMAMIEAGADRIGTSSGVAIISGAEGGEGY
ncbi:MAG TPA: deoxyribose-phosphate aldolase [Candidatus Kapabacteria bacterium]|nr:deoxyribose-phosphate aldolase [Candidatus Kapabacteria bacterium]